MSSKEDKNTIRQTLETLAREQLQWDKDTLDRARHNDNLADYLDSMKSLALVIAIEDHWQICLEPEHEEQIHTLDDLVSIIHAIVLEKAVLEKAVLDKNCVQENNAQEKSQAP